VEDAPTVGNATIRSDDFPAAVTANGSIWRPPKSRIDHAAEAAALACVHRKKPDKALDILMRAYGTPLTAFALRMVRNRELANDVRQQVFLEALQGVDRFQERSSLWSWLCGIAYHRCLDERRRLRRASAADDFEALYALAGAPDPMMDPERAAKRRALEQCLGQLSPAMRTQLLMRFFFGLSYDEIGKIVGATHSAVQVRMSRLLPQLRRCLRGEGLAR